MKNFFINSIKNFIVSFWIHLVIFFIVIPIITFSLYKYLIPNIENIQTIFSSIDVNATLKENIDFIYNSLKEELNNLLKNSKLIIIIFANTFIYAFLAFLYLLFVNIYLLQKFFNKLKNIEIILTKTKNLENFYRENHQQYEKELNKLQNALHWSGKIDCTGDNNFTKKMWLQLKKEYLVEEKNNIEANKIVTNLYYYPNITENIFRDFLAEAEISKHKITFTLVSTLPPNNYFNFPMEKMNDKRLEYAIEFIDNYRKNFEDLMEKFKQSNYVDFNRYTLVSKEELSDRLKDKTDIISLDSFKKLKNKYLVKDSHNNFEMQFLVDKKESLAEFEYRDYENKKEYIFDDSDGKNKIDILDYYIKFLHSEEKASYIIPLTSGEIESYIESLNFLKIEIKNFDKENEVIYIKANLNIEKDTVAITIIDNIKKENDKKIKEFDDFLKSKCIPTNNLKSIYANII